MAQKAGGKMALKIIGAGLGRTGTKSLQTALAMLGFGPCHHAVEVFAHLETIPLWIDAGRGKPDWDAIFAGYNSTVDYPSAPYWRELAAHYPDAKVLLSVRDADQWFDSTQSTIFAPGGMPATSLRADATGPMADFFKSFSQEFCAHVHDRAFMTAYFHRHNQAVKAAIPAERLLVYEAGQGWAPLCTFLGVPIPDAPYPSENNRAEFVARLADKSSGELEPS
jgi:hypothetical protein